MGNSVGSRVDRSRKLLVSIRVALAMIPTLVTCGRSQSRGDLSKRRIRHYLSDSRQDHEGDHTHAMSDTVAEPRRSAALSSAVASAPRLTAVICGGLCRARRARRPESCDGRRPVTIAFADTGPTGQLAAPTALVLGPLGPDWGPDQSADWERTVKSFTDLLREGGIDADLDLFHQSDTSIDWTRWGPKGPHKRLRDCGDQ